jgi:hypothetical protein
VELLACEQLEPACDHVDVAALRDAGVVFVRDAAIAGLTDYALRPDLQSVGLGVGRRDVPFFGS